jgi:hypothetical protein
MPRPGESGQSTNCSRPMWPKYDQYKLLSEQLARENSRLVSDLNEARHDLKEERERNRVREEAILDRVLTKHGSRPVTPPVPAVQVVAVPLRKSEEEEARRRDFIAEEIEHKGLTPEQLTPHMRQELDRMFEEWEVASK